MIQQNKRDPKPIRCAIYTRKSTSEGLDQEFSSLDAQRLSASNFIASQVGEGKGFGEIVVYVGFEAFFSVTGAGVCGEAYDDQFSVAFFLTADL